MVGVVSMGSVASVVGVVGVVGVFGVVVCVVLLTCGSVSLILNLKQHWCPRSLRLPFNEGNTAISLLGSGELPPPNISTRYGFVCDHKMLW